MSESDEERPLTRRELRLREMAAAEASASDHSETEAVETTSEVSEAEVDAPEDDVEARVLQFEPEISQTDPDGAVRSRREMRLLREEAIEEYRQKLLAEVQHEAASVDDELTDASVDLEATQAMSLQDLDVDDLVAADLEAAAIEAVEVEDDELEGDEPHSADDDSDLRISDDEESDADDQDASDNDAAEGADEGSGYSFPDIAPLDEGGSVFDDPDARAQNRASDSDDFDDLITRAVAQEGSGNTSGTSALILPDMGHTGGLAGSLGASGELFVTGSFELPKSLGETGGHSSILDALDDDEEYTFGAGSADSAEIAPVAAARTVSARSKMAVVAEPEKERSRKPLILILTGGGLLLAIAGLATWAFTTGFFA